MSEKMEYSKQKYEELRKQERGLSASERLKIVQQLADLEEVAWEEAIEEDIKRTEDKKEKERIEREKQREEDETDELLKHQKEKLKPLDDFEIKVGREIALVGMLREGKIKLDEIIPDREEVVKKWVFKKVFEPARFIPDEEDRSELQDREETLSSARPSGYGSFLSEYKYVGLPYGKLFSLSKFQEVKK